MNIVDAIERGMNGEHTVELYLALSRFQHDLYIARNEELFFQELEEEQEALYDREFINNYRDEEALIDLI